MSKYVDDIYKEVVEHLNDVEIHRRMHYDIFINDKTWNKFREGTKKELEEMIKTECWGEIKLSPYLPEGKVFLVNTRSLHPDIFDMNL